MADLSVRLGVDDRLASELNVLLRVKLILDLLGVVFQLLVRLGFEVRDEVR